MNVEFKTGPMFTQRTNVRQVRNASPGSINTTHNLLHSVEVYAGKNHQGNIQADYSQSETEYFSGGTKYRKTAIGGDWRGLFEIFDNGEFRTTIGSSIGKEGYAGESTALIYSGENNASFAYPILKWMKATISNNLVYQNSFSVGRTMNNRAMAAFIANPDMSTNISLELSRSISRYIDQTYFPQTTITGGTVAVASMITRSTNLAFSIRRELQESFRTNILTNLTLKLLQREIIRDLHFSVDANYSKYTYPRIETIRLTSGLTYQIYAYSLEGNYIFDTFALYKVHGFFLGIKRQFSMDFR